MTIGGPRVLAQAPQTATPPRAAAPKPPPAAPDAALPAARTIIDRHIAAVGGRKAILARNSMHATGTVSIASQGMTGPVEVFAAKPNKMLQRLSISGIGQIEEGFDGTVGWSLSPMTGPSLAQGPELEQKRFDADFYSELHEPARYESMSTVEKATFEGRPCYKVRLARRGGVEEFEFYDVETGLKAGGITTRESPMGPITATTVEGGYRRFGALLQATTLTSTAMGLQQSVTLTTVEFDTVSPSVFEAPAAIKALVK
ncbi:MAG: hypothetical protein ABIX28_02805 [Vicinamibacterales bacterium]